jgi:hypothetical protein
MLKIKRSRDPVAATAREFAVVGGLAAVGRIAKFAGGSGIMGQPLPIQV